MSAKQTAAQILGNPPWTDDQLTRAYFSDFTGIYRALHVHPGYRSHAELEQLTLSKRLFDKAVLGLQAGVKAFLIHSSTRGFRTRKCETEFADLTLSVQAALFQATTTTIAFENRARCLGKRLAVSKFDERFKTAFKENKRHQFVLMLRDHFSHVAPLVAEWQLSRAGPAAPKVAKFLLQVADLDDASKQSREGWNSLSLDFIDSHRPSGAIDVVLLFTEHGKQLHEFYDWLYPAAEVNAGADLSNYREVEKRFNRIAMRVAWKGLLLQWMNQTTPRVVLDQYLTDAEIGVVDDLPANSREQVDQIIVFLDADHAFVDDEIRSAIYKRFGVEIPP